MLIYLCIFAAVSAIFFGYARNETQNAPPVVNGRVPRASGLSMLMLYGSAVFGGITTLVVLAVAIKTWSVSWQDAAIIIIAYAPCFSYIAGGLSAQQPENG